MTAAMLGQIAPLVVVALTAVVAMLMAPLARARTIRAMTAAGFVLAFLALSTRFALPGGPVGDLLADDAPARFGAALSLLAGLGILAFTRSGEGREGPALVALAVAGALTLSGATHAATLFLGLEITTLALIVMTVFPRDAPAVEAGYKTFVMAGVAAAALLLGAAFGLAATGSLALTVWTTESTIAGVGLALVLAALAFKFSLVPFHMWVPDLFAGAPAAAAALAGAVSKIAVGVALVRLDALGPAGPAWSAGLALAGAGAVILGNLVALRQDSLMRMLGYSSIAQSGYMALVLGSGAAASGEVVLFYLMAYAPTVVAALLVAGLLGRGARVVDLRGLVWAQPVAGTALAVALLSMAGLPPTAGFVSKLYVFSALAGQEAWRLLAVAIAGSALAVFYYLRFAVRAFAMADAAPARQAPWPGITVLGAATGLVILAGIYPEPFVHIVRAAVP